MFNQMDLGWEKLYKIFKDQHKAQFNGGDAKLIKLTTMMNSVFTSQMSVAFHLQEECLEQFIMHVLAPDYVIDARKGVTLSEVLLQPDPLQEGGDEGDFMKMLAGLMGGEDDGGDDELSRMLASLTSTQASNEAQ